MFLLIIKLLIYKAVFAFVHKQFSTCLLANISFKINFKLFSLKKAKIWHAIHDSSTLNRSVEKFSEPNNIFHGINDKCTRLKYLCCIILKFEHFLSYLFAIFFHTVKK